MPRARAVEEVKYNEHLGDLNDFYEENQRLIHSVCKRYNNVLKRKNLEYEDVFQVASLGFLKAYERFDPVAYETKFSTYAVPMMIGEIQRFLRDTSREGGLKVPRPVWNLAYHINRDEMRGETPEAIAERYEVKIEVVMQALDYIRSGVSSLDNVIFSDKDGEDITLEDRLGVEEDFSSVVIDDFLSMLEEKDRKIVELTMTGLYTQRQIGDIMGYSQVHVSRILKGKIGDMLRKYMEGKEVTDGTRPYHKKSEKEDENMTEPFYEKTAEKELAKKSVRQLILEGYSTPQICLIKDCSRQAVYSMKSKIKAEKEAGKQAEKLPKAKVLDEPISKTKTIPEAIEEFKIDIRKELYDEVREQVLAETTAEKLAKENNPKPQDEVVLMMPVVELPEPKLEKPKKSVQEPKKPKKQEFNILTSGSGSKEELMSEFSKLIDMMNVLGVKSVNYYISVQSED